MEYISWTQVGKAHLHGRTFEDAKEGILYLNWTLSGLEVDFTGTCLLVVFVARAGQEVECLPTAMDGSGQTFTRPTWPVAAVFLDGEEEPYRRFEITAERRCELLFHSEKKEHHRIRLVKLTENIKTFLGISGFLMEGGFGEIPQEPDRGRIEFLGDSITCGFGNEARDPNRLFFSRDENGWLSHAAIAGRMLGMETSLVSSSGICACKRPSLPHPYSLEELYPYADRPLQEQLGVGGALREWDFARAPQDYVVVNLGTNDSTAIFLSEDPGAEEEAFFQDYIRFLKLLREKNGGLTQLICALGSMDYYLFPTIEAAVKEYQRETGDERIHVFRYPRIDVREPLGACAHPHVSTHRRMARALVDWMERKFPELGEN